MDHRGKIGITGAGGQLGRRVVELVAERIDPDRIVALTRSPEKLADLAERGVRVAFGDFDRPDELRSSLHGIDRLLIISTDGIGTRVRQHADAVRAAVEAGVSHLTYTSAPAPESSPLGFIREHGETERIIRESGVSYAFLRNNLYTELLLPAAANAIATGEFRSAAGDGKISRVSREDCAHAAAALLTTPGHDRVTYDITGPASVTGYDIAEALSSVAGRQIRYLPLSAEEMLSDLTNAGIPSQFAEMFVGIDRAISDGLFDIAGTAVRDLTGVEPAGIEKVFARQSELLTVPALN